MQTNNPERTENDPVPGHPIICHGVAPTDQPTQPPMKGNQRRIIAAEQFITDVLEGLHTIATERRILRRAVERANIETDGKSFLAEVLDLTTPASAM